MRISALLLLGVTVGLSAKVTFSSPVPSHNVLLSYLQQHPEVTLPWLDDFCAAMQPDGSLHNRRGRGYIRLFFDKDIAEHVVVPLMRSRQQLSRRSDEVVELFDRRAPHLWYKWVDQTDQAVRNMFASTALREETYDIARAVYKKVRGHKVIILGQTPVYVGAMLKGLVELAGDTITKVHFIPFSGWPDLVTSNLTYKEHIVYNLVTPFQEQSFYQIATERGVSPADFAANATQKVFIIDRSKGPSIAAFCLLLARWCGREAVTLPDLQFLHLGPYHKLTSFDARKRMTCQISPTMSCAIDCSWVEMSKDVDACFDGELGNDLRYQPPFPALLWTPQHVERLFSTYPTAQARELFEQFAAYPARMHETTANS